MNINGGELLIILLVALVVLGPQELPRIARTLGSVVREFRRASRGLAEELGLDDWQKQAAAPGDDPPGQRSTTQGGRGDRERGSGDREGDGGVPRRGRGDQEPKSGGWRQ